MSKSIKKEQVLQLDVDKAKEQWVALIQGYLYEHGWEYDIRKMYPWFKWIKGRHMQACNVEEAYTWELQLNGK